MGSHATGSIAPAVDLDTKEGCQQLAISLKSRGYAIVRPGSLKISQSAQELLQQTNKWKEWIEELFSSENIRNEKDLKLIQQESGSGDNAEFKQSWEFARENDTSNSRVAQRLRMWSEIQHTVANKVASIMNVEQTLCHDSPLDLLRAFRYDAVATKSALGSSPHTDWGSWTVVWQDDVGGLETFNQGQWKAVSSPCDCFVVHVSDYTSLATGWPSPRHRVVSSEKIRHSLVYFAYPPPQSTLQDLMHAPVATTVDYSHYSLLQNQSVQGATESPQECYQCILQQTVAQTVHDKWKQVQR